MSDDDGDVPISTLQVACEEGRNTIDQQVKWIRQIDQKANRVLRANMLLLGLILTALSLVLRGDSFEISPFVNVHTGFGIILLLGSTICAALTYISSRYEGGVDHTDINEAIEDSYSETKLYNRLSRGYRDWIDYNDLAIKVNAVLITITISLLIDAVVFLTTGITIGAIGVDGNWMTYILFIALGGFLLMLNWMSWKVDDFLTWYHNGRR